MHSQLTAVNHAGTHQLWLASMLPACTSLPSWYDYDSASDAEYIYDSLIGCTLLLLDNLQLKQRPEASCTHCAQAGTN